MGTKGVKKTLILVTRVTSDNKEYEYSNDWKNGWFESCEKIPGVKIDCFKAHSQDNRTLIVLSGDGLHIGNYSGSTNASNSAYKILEFYNENLNIIKLLNVLRLVVGEGNHNGKILVALHWDNRLLIGEVDKAFQNLENESALQNELKTKAPKEFNKLYRAIEWPPNNNEQDSFILKLPDRLKFPTGCQYTDYTIGGDRSILPQVRGMVNSLENNLAGFDKAFDDLWVGIKGTYTILHMVSILLGYLKVQLYDAGQSPLNIKDKNNIIASIKYLCTGEQSDNILQEAENTLTRREENLKDWILSEFDWGGEANKTLEEYLANLPSYIENYKPDEFISFCSKFRDFIQDIALGRKPKEIDED
ncbi:MAG: hypothetical protein KJ550_03870 [Proteobacteria bacterium]|nr:hypothetical protein [Pseudomonadota bacterium]MBU4068298.1 hypothetical protein [Pseudomonadota bacterium]